LTLCVERVDFFIRLGAERRATKDQPFVQQ
jgi:hypothetical protein